MGDRPRCHALELACGGTWPLGHAPDLAAATPGFRAGLPAVLPVAPAAGLAAPSASRQSLPARTTLQRPPPVKRIPAVGKTASAVARASPGIHGMAQQTAARRSDRRAATTRQLLCRDDKPMVHCLRRVTPYGSRIAPDRRIAQGNWSEPWAPVSGRNACARPVSAITCTA